MAGERVSGTWFIGDGPALYVYEDVVLAFPPRPISTYLHRLAERAHYGLSLDTDNPLHLEASEYIRLTYPVFLEEWTKAEVSETRVMRFLLASAMAESDGK